MIKLIEQINVLIKFLKVVNEKQPIIFYSEGNGCAGIRIFGWKGR